MTKRMSIMKTARLGAIVASIVVVTACSSNGGDVTPVKSPSNGTVTGVGSTSLPLDDGPLILNLQRVFPDIARVDGTVQFPIFNLKGAVYRASNAEVHVYPFPSSREAAVFLESIDASSYKTEESRWVSFGWLNERRIYQIDNMMVIAHGKTFDTIPLDKVLGEPVAARFQNLDPTPSPLAMPATPGPGEPAEFFLEQAASRWPGLGLIDDDTPAPDVEGWVKGRTVGTNLGPVFEYKFASCVEAENAAATVHFETNMLRLHNGEEFALPFQPFLSMSLNESRIVVFDSNQELLAAAFVFPTWWPFGPDVDTSKNPITNPTVSTCRRSTPSLVTDVKVEVAPDYSHVFLTYKLEVARSCEYGPGAVLTPRVGAPTDGQLHNLSASDMTEIVLNPLSWTPLRDIPDCVINEGDADPSLFRARFEHEILRIGDHYRAGNDYVITHQKRELASFSIPPRVDPSLARFGCEEPAQVRFSRGPDFYGYPLNGVWQGISYSSILGCQEFGIEIEVKVFAHHRLERRPYIEIRPESAPGLELTEVFADEDFAWSQDAGIDTVRLPVVPGSDPLEREIARLVFRQVGDSDGQKRFRLTFDWYEEGIREPSFSSISRNITYTASSTTMTVP